MGNESNEKPRDVAVSSSALLDLVKQAMDCADSAIGDTDPPDLDEYLDYPEELADEYPLVFIFHRLLEMRQLLESNSRGGGADRVGSAGRDFGKII